MTHSYEGHGSSLFESFLHIQISLSIKYLSMTNYRAGMTDAADQKEPYESLTHELFDLDITNSIS